MIDELSGPSVSKSSFLHSKNEQRPPAITETRRIVAGEGSGRLWRVCKREPRVPGRRLWVIAAPNLMNSADKSCLRYASSRFTQESQRRVLCCLSRLPRGLTACDLTYLRDCCWGLW